MLKSLENLELVGITFIRNYIQFLFDGPILNTYTLPQIKVQNKIVTSSDFGYCDTLCMFIGKKITSAYEDKIAESIIINFENNMVFFVSLKSEDRNCVEAATLQFDTEGGWNVW